MQGQSLLHRKAKIPFPAGLLHRRFSPCRPGSEAGVPGAVAPCIGKPKSPSPLGPCVAGSARAVRVQPRGCKGRSPLHKKTKNLPLPRWAPAPQVQPMPSGFSPGDARGKAPCIRKQKIPPFPAGEERSASAGRGDRGKNKAKGRGSRQPNRQAPRWAPAPQVQPVPLPAQARGCKGRSPLHEITLVSPFPAGEERSASAGRGVRGQEIKLKAG